MSTNGVVPQPAVATVELGGESYAVVPQRVGRVKKHLGRELASLSDIQVEGGIGGFVDEGLERVWRILKVLIPDLMPMYEFMGYRSAEAMENDDFEEEGREYGPTFPEIVTALEVVLQVNRIDLLKQLGKVVDLELIRLQVNRMVANAMADSMAAMTTSASTPSTTGLPTPTTTSGTTQPTSVSSGD